MQENFTCCLPIRPWGLIPAVPSRAGTTWSRAARMSRGLTGLVPARRRVGRGRVPHAPPVHRARSLGARRHSSRGLCPCLSSWRSICRPSRCCRTFRLEERRCWFLRSLGWSLFCLVPAAPSLWGSLCGTIGINRLQSPIFGLLGHLLPVLSLCALQLLLSHDLSIASSASIRCLATISEEVHPSRGYLLLQHPPRIFTVPACNCGDLVLCEGVIVVLLPLLHVLENSLGRRVVRHPLALLRRSSLLIVLFIFFRCN